MKKLLLAFLLCTVPLIGRADDYLNEALSNSAALVAAGSRNLMGGYAINLANAPIYLHFYNAAAAADVTVGTTTQVYVVGIPTTGAAFFGNSGYPLRGFPLGIVVAATTSPLYTGTTAPSTALVVQLHY